jgi:hypothetical protein
MEQKMKRYVLPALLAMLVTSSASKAQEDVIEEIVVEAASIETGNYLDLLEFYTDYCDLDADEVSDPYQFACSQLQALIEVETGKKIALSKHTVAVFHRQGKASIIILGLVIFVVTAGIGLAAYQLWVAVSKGDPKGSTELEASASKVRITSSSVGVIVLTLSLVFLYLYITEVYRINIL